MLQTSQTRRCREFTGPTPHSVAVRAKLPRSRLVDQLIVDRQKQDAARGRAVQLKTEQQSCDVKNSWLKKSDGRFLRRTIERRVQAAVRQNQVQIQDRRDRLRVLLQMEEQQLLQEMEEKVETSVERQAKMRERARTLRERRERETAAGVRQDGAALQGPV
ncbi:Cilia- and flagella-associated protein 53 [Larimichthys crocea]|uniref:Cilia-and flagella-associated protein 53 n=1 Tax=Larimichthys crocea TaxID=215358 RepID=A0A6G0I2R7_LARCR|nr:Cilia- and flagella-associated protein 53 [Larimichthys crocea]